MRQFIYDLGNGRFSNRMTEKQVLFDKKTGFFAGSALFELVPREVVTVTKQEIQ